MSDPLDGKVDEAQAPLRQAESSSRRRRLRSAATKRRLYQLAFVDCTANNVAGKEACYVESRADAFVDSLVLLYSSDSTTSTVKRSVNLDAEPSYVEFLGDAPSARATSNDASTTGHLAQDFSHAGCSLYDLWVLRQTGLSLQELLRVKNEVFVDNLITSYAYLSAENIDIVQPSLEMVDSSAPIDIISDSSLDDWPSWAEAFAADKAANNPSLADVNEIIINVATNASEVQRLVVSYEEKISSYEEKIENLTNNIENITDLGQQLFERLERLETDASCRH